MNEILIRTNRHSYVPGNTIYGAVFMRITEPAYGDTLFLEVKGEETVFWTETKIDRKRDDTLLPNQYSKQKSPTPSESSHDGANTGTLKNSTLKNATLKNNTLSNLKSYQEEIFFKDRTYESHKKLINTPDFEIHKFQGAVPLGSYVFPFQYLLQEGLPSSFHRMDHHDAHNQLTYTCCVEYTISAKLRGSTSVRLQGQQEVCIEYDDTSAQTQHYKIPHHMVERPVFSCCCVGGGNILLSVSLEKWKYNLDETVNVRFEVKNQSSKMINSAAVRLNRVLVMKGRPSPPPNTSVLDVDDAPESEKPPAKKQGLLVVPFERPCIGLDVKNKHQRKEVPIHLFCALEESLTSTIANHFKCQYSIEVVLDVPDDLDISVSVPIVVNDTKEEYHVKWEPPEWTEGCKIINSEYSILAVDKNSYDSEEFKHVKLPHRPQPPLQRSSTLSSTATLSSTRHSSSQAGYSYGSAPRDSSSSLMMPT